MTATTKVIGALALTCALVLGAFGGMGQAAEFENYALESTSTTLSTNQAGAHADLTTAFSLTQKEGLPYADTRDITVELPPGVIGNPQAIPMCTVAELGQSLEEFECPVDTQVGVTEIVLAGLPSGTFVEPIYNMPAPGGDVVARLGFFAGTYPTFINIRVNPSNYALVASIEGASAAAGLVEAVTTLWGVPAASAHDPQRLTPVEAEKHLPPPGGGRESGLGEVPFLSNPTSCGTPRQVTTTVDSYQLPGRPSTMSATFPAITGCGKLRFEPTLNVTPTSSEAASPTGVDADLEIPQDESPRGRATSSLRSAVVALPPGLTINPAAGAGLESCSEEQVGYGTNQEAACPNGAKIGSAEIDVPALEHVLHGAVYQRTPAPGNLFRFWLVADELGVHLKLPAEIKANPTTGQLTTVFAGIPSLAGNPQVPVSDLKLHIFGGPRAPLSTPSQCGTYQTHYELAPWSGNPPATGETAMQITSGCGKGGFAPSLSGGTLNSSAASYSPFVLELTRADGEGNPQVLEVTLPRGLLAKVNGVPLCPDSSAASGACPAGSQVGSVQVAAGVGGAPLWVPQPGKAPTAIYLAGPYRGAPYSLVIKVPAQAGPFDLGTVVTRAAIHIDPLTTQVTVVSDPLPQILEGVPIAYRAIDVDIDRPEFTLNPTNCDPANVTARVSAVGGAVANPQTGYQATNCARLAFSPTLKLFLTGQMKRTGNPGVKAVLTQPKGQNANLAGTTVVLPKGMFIDQSHINNPCTRVQFNSTSVAGEGCPVKSVLGTAKVWTPLLEKPEQGKVYFRSNGGERELPDLVVALQGQIPIQLVGFIDSVGKKHSEVRRVRTRFQNVPDAPVSRFELKLAGGKKGLLENSENLCKTGDRASFYLAGQNGKTHATEPKVQVSCGKRGKKKTS